MYVKCFDISFPATHLTKETKKMGAKIIGRALAWIHASIHVFMDSKQQLIDPGTLPS